MINLRKHAASLIVLLLIATLLMAACGGGGAEDTGSATAPAVEPTPTEEPAPTAEPTAAEEPTPAGEEELPATDTLTGTQPLTGTETVTATDTLTDTSGVVLDLDVIQGPSVLASAVIGYRIRNLAGDKIGEIEDVVVNMVDGHVLFVTMTYDGGIFQSAKVFPVPAGAFTWDPEHEELQLDLDEATLEEAPGFESGWPNMTAEGYNPEEYDAEVYAYWFAQFPELPAPPETYSSDLVGVVAKVSDMIGLGVRNPQDESIGEISDIIMNAERQQLSAAVLAFKGFRLIGDDNFVIPYAAFSLDVSSVDRNNPIGTPILNISQDNLANAPTFDLESEDLADPNWSQPYQSWWERMAEQTGTAEGVYPLAMTAWVLESFGEPEDNLPVIPGTRPSVNFLVERYTGYGGCNWFLGVYTADESGLLRIQTPATTVPAICEPVGIMDQEGTFMASLLNITEYQLEGEKLVGYTVQNQRMVTLAPAEPVPFESTLWALRFFLGGIQGIPLIYGTEITAQFEGDQISGFAGCNTYTATTVRDVAALTITDLAVTDQTCAEPEGIMEQEARFLTDLLAVAGHVHIGNTVQMADVAGLPILLFGTDIQPDAP